MYSNLAITYLQDNIVFVTVAVEVLMRRKNPIHLSPVHTGDKVDCCQNRRQILAFSLFDAPLFDAV